MGNCLNKDATDASVKKTNSKIEKQIRNDKKQREFQIKLLLLGAGESGKSTFAKQIKILFLEGYSKQELSFYKDIIHSNVVTGMRTILHEVEKRNLTLSVDLEVSYLTKKYIKN